MMNETFHDYYRVSIDPIRIGYSIVPALLTLFTVFGNSFVVLAICFNSRLYRKCTSVLIFNLALADLLIGLAIMPMAVLQIMTGGVWLLTRMLCRVWTSLDVICSTASIVTLCIISVDRFIGVTRPLKYVYLVTKRRLAVSMVLVWLFSLMTLLVTIRWVDARDSDPRVCVVGNELEHVISSVVLSFFIPLLIIVLIYTRIYMITTRREESLNPEPPPPPPRAVELKRAKSILVKNPKAAKEVQAAIFAPLRIHYGGSAFAGNGDSTLDTLMQNRKRKFFRMHMKTTKTLGLVVGAFIVCWLPFFVLYSISNVFHDTVPDLALDICAWLGYSNSALNPIIYAVSMRSFGRTFSDIFFRHIFYPLRTCCGACGDPHAFIRGYDSSRKSSDANTLLTNCNNNSRRDSCGNYSRRDSVDSSAAAVEYGTPTANGGGAGRRSVDFHLSQQHKRPLHHHHHYQQKIPSHHQTHHNGVSHKHEQHRTSVDHHRQVLVKKAALRNNARSFSLACPATAEQQDNLRNYLNSYNATEL